MGFIALRGVRVKGKIGVSPEERLIGRNFEVDVQIGYPLAKASLSDKVTDTFDYGIAALAIDRQFQKEFHLMEAACKAIGDEILAEDKNIQTLKIRVRKLAPFVGGDVASAEVEWYYPEDNP